MKAEELEIRRRLWATHPCFGKYCDDGELQCGTFLPPIDFLRDDLLDIAEKIAKHSVEQVIEARKDVKEWVEKHSCLERCDPDTEAYFCSYRWISEEEWQDFKRS